MADENTTPETTAVAPIKKELPTLQELNYDVEKAFEKDQFNLLVNQPPPKSWVKIHPMLKTEYLPIDRVEHLLTRIFQDWSVEVLREGALFQSVYCAVRLHVTHPVTGKAMFFDGVGAVPVQVDKGKSASDLSAIKSAAIQMALPAAKTYALKDSAEHIGKLFGKDLNRASAIDFAMSYTKPEEKTPEEALDATYEETTSENIPKAVVEGIRVAGTKKEAHGFWVANPDLQQFPELQELIKKRYAEIDLLILQEKNKATQ